MTLEYTVFDWLSLDWLLFLLTTALSNQFSYPTIPAAEGTYLFITYLMIIVKFMLHWWLRSRNKAQLNKHL